MSNTTNRTLTWKKTGGWPSAEPTGYAMETTFGQATLRKSGAGYILRLRNLSATMCRKSTLDHAESQLRAWGVS